MSSHPYRVYVIYLIIKTVKEKYYEYTNKYGTKLKYLFVTLVDN